jgi:hypothetical protein
MRPRELTKTEFEATFGEGMKNVTSLPEAIVDIWPYAREVASSVDLPPSAIEGSLVEYVYRSSDEHYDHVLIPTGERNVFLVVVVDRKHGSVFGHRLLDLNAEYGLPPRA